VTDARIYKAVSLEGLVKNNKNSIDRKECKTAVQNTPSQKGRGKQGN
jgi:hypothetical protein